MSTSETADHTAQQVAAAEARRCQAITDDDYETIAEILTQDVWYQHSNGFTDDKASFLASLGRRQRSVERGPLDIRVYGDAAVVIGGYHIVSSPRKEGGAPARQIYAEALQTWVRQDGDWKLAAHLGVKATPADELDER